MSIGKNSDTNFEGCGISKIWALPSTHWATSACQVHDAEYLLNEWRTQNKTRKQVDREFLASMLEHASSARRKATAYFLYAVARVGGAFYW